MEPFKPDQIRFMEDLVLNRLLKSFKKCCPLLKFEHEMREEFGKLMNEAGKVADQSADDE